MIIVPGRLKILKEFNLDTLKEVVLPKNNAVLMILKFNKNDDCLIENYKRFEIVRFIYQVCDECGIKKIKVSITDRYTRAKRQRGPQYKQKGRVAERARDKEIRPRAAGRL